MKQTRNASLKHLNSFSVEAQADRLLELESEEDVQRFFAEHRFDVQTDLILGGGSNILFAGDVKGTVILNRVHGKRIVEHDGDDVLVEASAGENWHQLVLWCLDKGLSGIENLSLIPGLAGAAPMQNIGAYGVELSDVLDSVQTLDLRDGQPREFTHAECRLAYRDSRFKSADAGRYLITGMRLRLHRTFTPRLAYKGLVEELSSMGIGKPTPGQVSKAVVRIRRRKLPDPGVVGNAGSFFKNPVVNHENAELFKRDFSGLPVYPSDDGIKLSAAWLIEHCGWKGRALGLAAVSEQHALVLINKGGATGSEILALADAIRTSVRARFGIELEPEPRIICP